MAEKIQFYPVDITYKIEDEKPVIYLFARSTDGRQIVILDDTFLPYFYVIPKKNKDLAKKIEKIEVEEDDKVSKVLKTEKVKKKIFGKDVDAVKVFTALPRDVPIIRKIIKEWDDVDSINEYDILFTRRYLIDNKIIPMTLHEAEVEETTSKAKVPAYRSNKIENINSDTFGPKILAFDIETYNPDRNIEPEKNPIIMIALYGEKFRKVFVWKKFNTKHDYVEFVDSEVELIEKFAETVEAYKPDILTGYFSDGFDFPYIKKRADKYKIKLNLGLDNSEVSIKGSGVTKALITGYIHLDIFKFIRRVIGINMETDAFNLNAVASELLNEKKTDVDLDELSSIWDDHPEMLEKFCEYNLNDSALTYKLTEKTYPTIIEMIKIVGLTVSTINRMGFSQLVEWFLIKEESSFDEIAPNKPGYNEIKERRMNTYEGGFVFEPKPGLYNDLVVFDYRSLYPTIISSHNISPGTLKCSCCKDTAKKIPLEKEELWFCKKKKGFIPTLIEDLITRRMRIKEIINKGNDDDITENSFLEARQNTLKLMANSFYGYLGFFGARWYSIESARATTALGRYYIKDVIERAGKKGFEVLYSDTDSIFLSLKDKSREEAEKFVDTINSKLPGLMELEYEGYYPSGIFVSAKLSDYGAKKKYALLSEKGTLKIKGFETVRRNWSNIAKETQEKVLDIVLKKGDKEKSLTFVKKMIDDLRNNKIPIEKVTIHTQLKKDLTDYAARGPHVAAAERMKNKGMNIGAGMLIKYVVTKGKGSISNRAKLPEEITTDDIDSEYYINNQVIPAIEQIFKVIGYSKDDLLESKDQKKLDKFFG
jgi:DNA polymerase elongation subunit (family B)